MLLQTPSGQGLLAPEVEHCGIFFDLSPYLYCAIAPDGSFQQLNPAWSKLLGWDAQELKTHRWQDYIHPEDLNAFEQALQQSQTGEQVQLCTRYRHQNGSDRWISWQITATTTNRIACGHDITQQKQIELDLDRVFNLPIDLICLAGFDGYFKRLNASWSETLGYCERELLAQPFLDFVHPDDKETTIAAASQLAAGVQVVDFENRYRCKDGSYKWLAWRTVPLTEEKLLYAIARDITATKTYLAERQQIESALQQTKAELERRVVERTRTLQQTIEQLQTEMADRRRAEALLEKREQSLRAILDNAPIWIWQTDTRGKMQFVNKTFSENVGVPESSFLAVSHYKEILGEKESANCMASDAACWQSDIPHHSEERLPFVDGQLHDLEIIKATIKDASDTPIGLMGLAVDATERKQAERALQASEAKYRELARREVLLNRLAGAIRNSLDLDTILQTAVDEIRSLLQIDRCLFLWYEPSDGIETAYWEVVKESCDPQLLSLLGKYPANQLGSVTEILIGKKIIRADRLDAIADPIVRVFFNELGYTSVLALPIETHTGTIGVISCSQNQVMRPWSDSEVELLQMVTDALAIAINQAELYSQSLEASKQAQAHAHQLALALSELKQTQTQLIQSEKMSSLGQLVAGVAHEINNPVNFIYGNLIHASEYIEDLLSLVELYQQHEPLQTPEIQELQESIDLEFLIDDLPKLLESMRVGTNRIREIVRSLRNFSRLDEADMKVVDLHEGIESTLMILQSRLKAKGDTKLEIQVIKEYGQLPLVECYPGQLNQVFMNILANAIDALEENAQFNADLQNLPQIWIRTQLVEANRVRIAIADNGSGIPEQVKQRLFDPFFTTKSIGAGTGLGLSISYQIVVEKHGGQLTCNSQLGQGSEFVIEIPLNPQVRIS